MEIERISFVKNGVLIRLPPGFKFHPTDEELVVHYLERKVFASPLPTSIIPDFDVYKADPWDLPGDKEKERYFFSTREAKYPNGNITNRATLSGYWKPTGKDKPVFAVVEASNSNNHQVVDMKKTLVFYRGKARHGSRTDWIMHEYSLVDTNQSQPVNNLMQKIRGDWALCRIFIKKRNNAAIMNDDERNILIDPKLENPNPVFYDLNLPLPPCSSSFNDDIDHKDAVINDESSKDCGESISNNFS